MNFSMLSKSLKDITITKAELTEIVTNFESLAKIATEYMAQQTANDAADASSPQNSFQCDVIDIAEHGTDEEFHTKILNVLQNKPAPIINKDKNVKPEKIKKSKKKALAPVLEYVPKTTRATYDTVSEWRHSILFEHPLSAVSRFNDGGRVEPYILLGLFAQATHPKLRFTGRKENSQRIALTMNGEQTLVKVEDSLQCQVNDQKKNSILTFHGYQAVPDVFMKQNLFLGGNDLSTIEIVTRNPYCKGVSLLNNRLFWNPDLKIASKIIASGYGSVDQFRFFKGKVKWNNSLWTNIQDRNLYGYISTTANAGSSWSSLAKQLWTYHVQSESNGDNALKKNSLWYHLLAQCCEKDTTDIESWLQLFNLLHCGDIQHEIYQLMNTHDAKIMEQVKQWKRTHAAVS